MYDTNLLDSVQVKSDTRDANLPIHHSNHEQTYRNWVKCSFHHRVPIIVQQWHLQHQKKHLIGSPWDVHGWCSRWTWPWSFPEDPLQSPRWCRPCVPCGWEKTFPPSVALGWFWSRGDGKGGDYQESPPERWCLPSTRDYYREEEREESHSTAAPPKQISSRATKHDQKYSDSYRCGVPIHLLSLYIKEY